MSNPVATPSISTTYTLSVLDTNGCTGSATAYVFIQQKPPKIIWDTTIVIGQLVTMHAMGIGGGFIYVWTPPDTLSCTNCADPSIKPLEHKYFTLHISDTMGCFREESYYEINILPLSSVDIPTAFTPNSDGVNDIIYVDGWGIKKLLEYKIYNRWGELIFETTDIKTGWDGTYKGLPQNTESYAYTVSVETYIDKMPITKKGYIKLLR